MSKSDDDTLADRMRSTRRKFLAAIGGGAAGAAALSGAAEPGDNPTIQGGFYSTSLTAQKRRDGYVTAPSSAFDPSKLKENELYWVTDTGEIGVKGPSGTEQPPIQTPELQTGQVHNNDRQADVRVFKDGSEIVASGDQGDGELVRDTDLKNVLDKSTAGSVFAQLGGGIHVHLRAGDYGEPSGTITVPDADGTLITGSGVQTQITPPQNGQAFLFDFASASTANDTDTESVGGGIKHIRFETPSSVSESNRGDAIRVKGGNFFRIEGCYFKRVRYAIEVDQSDASKPAWRTHIRGNEAEVTHRFIELNGAHDPQVVDNHVEADSAANSGSTLSNTVGEVRGIALIDCVNGIVSDNVAEGIKDNDTDGIAFYIKNHAINLEFDNNYTEGVDNGLVLDYDTNVTEAALHFTNNNMRVDMANHSITAGTTDFDIQFNGHRGQIDSLGGNIAELNLEINGGRFGNNNDVYLSCDSGQVIIRGTQKDTGATNPAPVWWIENGTIDTLKVTDNAMRDLVVQGGATVGNMIEHGNTYTNLGVIIKESNTVVTRLVATGNIFESTGLDQLYDVRTGAEVSTIRWDNVMTATTSANLTNGVVNAGGTVGTEDAGNSTTGAS